MVHLIPPSQDLKSPKMEVAGRAFEKELEIEGTKEETRFIIKLGFGGSTLVICLNAPWGLRG